MIILSIATVFSKSLMQNTACSLHRPFVAMHNMSMRYDMTQSEYKNCHKLIIIHIVINSLFTATEILHLK